MNIKKLNEELEKLLEEDKTINELKLISHGEHATKYYNKAFEYFKKNIDKVKKGFINLPSNELEIHGEDIKSLGYEFK